MPNTKEGAPVDTGAPEKTPAVATPVAADPKPASVGPSDSASKPTTAETEKPKMLKQLPATMEEAAETNNGGYVVTADPPPPIPEDGVNFDFSKSDVAMGEKTRFAFNLMKRRARLANKGRGDASLMPEARVYSLAEIETALEMKLEDAFVASKCCGQ